MTARLVFEATLIELSKQQAPSLKLYEFNYLFNKAINQYINKVYNVYDINQQTTDDLRVLKATAFLTPHKVELSENNGALRNPGTMDVEWKQGEDTIINDLSVLPKKLTLVSTTTKTESKKNGAIETVETKKTEVFKSSNNVEYTKVTTYTTTASRYSGQATSYLSNAHRSIQSLHGATYEVYMPIDYLHMLNCVCIYYVAKQKDCWDAGSYIEIPATRLTADSWSQIISDIYNRPSPMRPYYYIHNLNKQLQLPTDPVTATNTGIGTGNDYTGVDMAGYPYKVTTNGYANPVTDGITTMTWTDDETSNFQRTFKLDLNGDGEGDSEATISLVEKPTAVRIGNTSNVRCEIRYGK